MSRRGRAAPTRIRKSDGCAECPYVATSMGARCVQHGDETLSEGYTPMIDEPPERFLMTPAHHRQWAANARRGNRPDLAQHHEKLAEAIEIAGGWRPRRGRHGPL
jgi:hypothetical protein